MLTSQLGRTSLHPSRLGFGCGHGAGLMVSDDHAFQRKVVEHALDMGVNFFDVAPAYGDGLAETNLGRALAEIGRERDDLVVGTKVALQYSDLDDIAGACARELATSLERLRLPNISILQLHNHVSRDTGDDVPEAPGPKLGLDHLLGAGGVLEALAALKQQGLVHAIAFTTFGADRRAVGELIGSGGFDVMDIEFSALDPSALYDCSRCAGRDAGCDHQTIVGQAVQRGMGVFGIRPLGGGSRAKETEPSEIGSRIATLVGSGEVSTFSEGALRFAMNSPGISSVVLGMRTLEHVDSAAEAVKLGPLPGIEYV